VRITKPHEVVTSGSVNSLNAKPERYLNNVRNFKCYFTENTMQLRYKDEPVNVV